MRTIVKGVLFYLAKGMVTGTANEEALATLVASRGPILKRAAALGQVCGAMAEKFYDMWEQDQNVQNDKIVDVKAEVVEPTPAPRGIIPQRSANG